jgi:hypothetical protein
MSAAEIKVKLIEAHRCGDWEAARVLSQAKVKARRGPRYCVDCGTRLSQSGKPGTRCRMHDIYHRFHARSLDMG